MNLRLVCDSILVLRVLSRGQKHVSTIIKETGLYKEYAHSAIKTLQRGQLVKEIKTRSHKQKKIQQLTELGLEAAKMMSYMEQTNLSHSDLKKSIIESFGVDEGLDETHIKNRLKARGWNPRDVEFYQLFTRYAILLIFESLNMIYNVITFRYSSLLLKYEINDIGKSIFKKIVTDAVEYQISFMGDILTIKRLPFTGYTADNDGRTRIIMNNLFSTIGRIEEQSSPLNKSIENQATSLMVSICSMLGASRSTIEEYISKVNSTLEVVGHDGNIIEPGIYSYKGVTVKDSHKEARRTSLKTLRILREMMKKSS